MASEHAISSSTPSSNSDSMMDTSKISADNNNTNNSNNNSNNNDGQQPPQSGYDNSNTQNIHVKTENSNSINFINQKRPVARRACLMCREKKIKCDGEPPATQHSSGFPKDQTPRTCSNCKYLGIECVFVRSNRGGRRRKRTDSMGESSMSAISDTSSVSKLPKPDNHPHHHSRWPGATMSTSGAPSAATPSSYSGSAAPGSTTAAPPFGMSTPTRNQIDYIHMKTQEYGDDSHHHPPPHHHPGTVISEGASSSRRSPSIESSASFYRDPRSNFPSRPIDAHIQRSPPPSEYNRHHTGFHRRNNKNFYADQEYAASERSSWSGGSYGEGQSSIGGPPPPHHHPGALGPPGSNGHLPPPSARDAMFHPRDYGPPSGFPHGPPPGPPPHHFGYGPPHPPPPPPPHHHHHHHPPPPFHYFQGYRGGPGPFGGGPPGPPPGPPPPQIGAGGGSGPPGSQDGKRWRSAWDTYHLPPPQALLNNAANASEDSSSRVITTASSVISAHAEPPQTNGDSTTNSIDMKRNGSMSSIATMKTNTDVAPNSSLVDNSSLLSQFDLPPSRTCEIFLDLYYRYIHVSFPILPSKQELILSYSPSVAASLLHVIFALVAPLASSNLIPEAMYRSHQHWINLVEKHWKDLDTTTSMCVLLLMFRYFMTTSGGGNNYEQAKMCLEKLFDLIEINDLHISLRHRGRAFYEKLEKLSTKRELSQRSQKINLLWAVWQCQLDFKIITEISLDLPQFFNEFPSDLELPSREFRTPVLSWTELQQLNEHQLSQLDDHHISLIASYTVDELQRLNPHQLDDVAFNMKLNKLISVFDKNLYKITSLQSSSIILDKKILVINAEILKSILQLQLLKTVINLPSVVNWFMFKPVNCFSYENLNDKSKSDKVSSFDITELSQRLLQNFDVSNIKHFFKVFNSALAIVKLLDIGYGIIDNDGGYSFPAVLGPTTYKSCSEIPGSLLSAAAQKQTNAETREDLNDEPWWNHFDDPNSVTAVKDQDVAELWPAYPLISSEIVSQTICVLASITLISKFVVFDNQDTHSLSAKIYKEPLTQAESDVFFNTQSKQASYTGQQPVANIVLEISSANFEIAPLHELSLNKLAANLRTCYRFLQCRMRYTTDVASHESVIAPINKIVEFIDQTLQRIG